MCIRDRYKATLKIKDLMLPPGQNFRITASTNIQDLSSNGIIQTGSIAQGVVKSAHDTGGMLGPGESAVQIDFFTMGIKPIAVFPQSSLAGATTRYRIEFPAEIAIPASGRITLTFPTGFTFADSCNTFPTDTFENSDINGPAPGQVTVSSISCNSVSRIVTLTLGNTPTQAGDMIRFEIQGVINSTVPKDYASTGYTVDIKTYNSSNTLLESKTSMPFFISAPGNLTLSGKVFVDNGAGGGTANDGIPNGSEPGIANVKICLGGPMIGFKCETTDANGDYSFTQLNPGFYHIDLPPLTSGNYSGGPFFRDINLTTNTSEYFSLQEISSSNILDVYITGGATLANTKLDVFGFSSSTGMTMGPGMGPGGFAVSYTHLTLPTN